MSPTTEKLAPQLRHPTIADGAALWRVARDSRVLDVNSPYAYLLWCRDFAATTVVATLKNDHDVVGFVTGYVRPDVSSSFVVWQVAVDERARGRGLAGSMLDWVFTDARRAQPGLTHLETTITDDNAASRQLFGSFARRHHTELERAPLFTTDLFPADSEESHNAEVLHLIGPISPADP